MRESVIEKYLVDKVKALGGEVRKVKWISRNSAPDRLVMLPDNTFWAELKAPKEKPTPAQAREHERMRKMGQRVEVIDSIERIEELLG
ncbi:TPA: VRR-NUC domain-containing protein [Acinetobacter baumannii]|uniref:VRR-NUC domain-containing protein n=1 Tax=Acinetobacter baumannii TaxID=470 RepID=UPI00028E689E|nr:VRR-NUC domain-containing protein [Acinetobacter baumannii]EHU1404053.1 VRR-NUC domain-containing protein [Acinetobacter baumannii]EHU2351591.1 VRR-NUC domain-containing protein [Acinetobacter baumannii]EHU2371935.1 VRR-NUC domain-containing protein [Acinetobacter baumannii]EHU2565593.1 VRR-NUC domain-containing protein [Acinetobacter baumannii]EHU2574199.1 VRR-NUC domain-containing protein [Acinetobacter baumannii]